MMFLNSYVIFESVYEQLTFYCRNASCTRASVSLWECSFENHVTVTVTGDNAVFEEKKNFHLILNKEIGHTL